MPWTNNYNSPVTPDLDSLASSVVKGSGSGSGSGEGVRIATYSDAVHPHPFLFSYVILY
jgi:hypothetical protein